MRIQHIEQRSVAKPNRLEQLGRVGGFIERVVELPVRLHGLAPATAAFCRDQRLMILLEIGDISLGDPGADLRVLFSSGRV